MHIDFGIAGCVMAAGAAAAAAGASGKRRNIFGWGLFGTLFAPIALVTIAWLPARKERDRGTLP